jgi:hypothetical protein
MVLVYKNLQNWVILERANVGKCIFQHHGSLFWARNIPPKKYQIAESQNPIDSCCVIPSESHKYPT